MRSLYAKLALILALLFALAGIVYVWLISEASARYQQEVTQKLNATLADQIVAERLLFRDGQLDREALEHIFHMLMVINPRVELYLLDPAGSVLAYSAPPGKVKRERVALAPIRHFLSGDYTAPLLGEDPRGEGASKVFSAAAIDIDGQRAGYLYVILASEQYDSVAAMLNGSYVVKVSALLAIGVAVFALAAGLVLFAMLTRRLRTLTRTVEMFASADARRSESGQPAFAGDEIDRLTHSFRAMADRIAEQMRRLEQTDSLRRELVANVSHDLRTPLASLRGHLETLSLRQDSLDAADRTRYLDTAQQQCVHLGRLVDALFELAKLDANEVKPVVEPFSMPELVQDVVQKFELRAQAGGVSLCTRLDGALPFVLGDIALIERALDNLIDNALRHTPAGGSVTVTLQPAAEGVAVCISDTGNGIAASDLPHIFERFYQPDDAGSRGGAGLGLAITRRIIELHGSVIRAASDLGRGTAFAFELPGQRQLA